MNCGSRIAGGGIQRAAERSGRIVLRNSAIRISGRNMAGTAGGVGGNGNSPSLSSLPSPILPRSRITTLPTRMPLPNVGSNTQQVLSRSRFYTTNTTTTTTTTESPQKRYTATPLTPSEYHALADTALDNLLCSLEDLADAGGPPKILDVEYSSGVLNLVVEGQGTWVINKQPPNKQIWLSSPVSGPRRFDWVGEREGWVCLREVDARDKWGYGIGLGELLRGEVSEKVVVEGEGEGR